MRPCTRRVVLIAAKRYVAILNIRNAPLLPLYRRVGAGGATAAPRLEEEVNRCRALGQPSGGLGYLGSSTCGVTATKQVRLSASHDTALTTS